MLKGSDNPTSRVLLQYIDAVSRILKNNDISEDTKEMIRVHFGVAINPDTGHTIHAKTDENNWVTIYRFGGAVINDMVVNDAQIIMDAVSSQDKVCEFMWEQVTCVDEYYELFKRLVYTNIDNNGITNIRIDNSSCRQFLPLDHYDSLTAITNVTNLCTSLLTLYTMVHPIVIGIQDIIPTSFDSGVPRSSISWYNFVASKYINYWSNKMYTAFGTVDFTADNEADDDIFSQINAEQLSDIGSIENSSSDSSSLFMGVQYAVDIDYTIEYNGISEVRRYKPVLKKTCLFGKITDN